MWREHVQIRTRCVLGVWLLAGLCWQIGLNYKSYFDTINKDEELDGTALWREEVLLGCCFEDFQSTSAEPHDQILKIYFRRAGSIACTNIIS